MYDVLFKYILQDFVDQWNHVPDHQDVQIDTVIIDFLMNEFMEQMLYFYDKVKNGSSLSQNDLDSFTIKNDNTYLINRLITIFEVLLLQHCTSLYHQLRENITQSYAHTSIWESECFLDDSDWQTYRESKWSKMAVPICQFFVSIISGPSLLCLLCFGCAGVPVWRPEAVMWDTVKCIYDQCDVEIAVLGSTGSVNQSIIETSMKMLLKIGGIVSLQMESEFGAPTNSDSSIIDFLRKADSEFGFGKVKNTSKPSLDNFVVPDDCLLMDNGQIIQLDEESPNVSESVDIDQSSQEEPM